MGGTHIRPSEVAIARQMRAKGRSLGEIAERLGRSKDTIRIHLKEPLQYQGGNPNFKCSVEEGSDITLTGDFTPEQIAAYRERFGHNRVAVCRDTHRSPGNAPRWNVGEGMAEIGGAA